MEISIFVKSSSNPESPYKVSFIVKDRVLKIFCSCPAGTYGQLCKHKTAIIEGDHKMLYDTSQHQLLNDIIDTINSSPLRNEYSLFKNKKNEIEITQRKLKEELKNIKKYMATKLQNGMEI